MVLMKGIFPPRARPAAMPTTLASLMPSMKKRSGISVLNFWSVPAPRSEPMNTTRGSFLASS